MTPAIRVSSSRSTGWARSTNAKPAIPHMLGGPREGSAIGPAPHPELEAEHGPKPGRTVSTPGFVRAQEPFDPGRSEDSALTRAQIQQQIMSHVAKLSSEPGSQRHTKTH